jgi:hypothetical protein
VSAKFLHTFFSADDMYLEHVARIPPIVGEKAAKVTDYDRNKNAAIRYLRAQMKQCPDIRRLVEREKETRAEMTGRAFKLDDVGDALRGAWYVAYILSHSLHAKRALPIRQ